MLYLKKIIILSALSVGIISFIIPAAEDENRSRHLEEVLSIGSLDDETLFQWVGIGVDNERNIYLTDAMDYALKKFNPKGHLVKKTGRQGQGPGEFLAPRYVDIARENVYVSDQFNPKIQVFNTEMDFLHSIPIPLPVADFCVLSGEKIAVASLSAAKAGRIHIFSSKGKLEREIQYSDQKLALMMDMVNFEFGAQGHLHLVYNYQDKIAKFDPSGKELWTRKILGVKKIKKEKIASFTLPSKLIYKDIALDSSGNIFILGGSFSRNPSQDVYVLNPEGKLLTTLTLPDTSHCIHIDSEGYLYCRANEGVTLKKFRLRY